jgi:hypothetical protein
MVQMPFGNDPAKIDKYLSFWNCDDVARPLVGFSLVGWFPMEEFAICFLNIMVKSMAEIETLRPIVGM